MAAENTRSRDGELLIVEDSPTQAEQLAHMTRKHGYQASIARNGKEALTVLYARKPMIVISDVVMPEMDGYQLCRHIKTDTSLQDIPVILVTTLSGLKDVLEGLQCGADNFIVKPYDEQYLLSRIRYVSSNRELRRRDSLDMGVEVILDDRKYFINSGRRQILDLLLSTYEAAIKKHEELSHAQTKLQAFAERLEQEVEKRTAALQTEIAERRRAEDNVRRLNADLERRVQERTAELATANTELEAFSYSVSHDLRAPLRHLDGFAQLLLKSAAGQLDDKSAHYVHTIANAALTMGALIDDLLAFSRTGRAEMRRQRVELSQLVKGVQEELASAEKDRRITWDIGLLPVVDADPALLRQVLVNLLSNALKFTRPRPEARVEVGTSASESGETVIFVRDNGVGFDPTYVDRLFGVFQRLHRDDEFEGTGIGLANVRRIIQRHGGRVWAEGQVDQGATFYFSLPRPPSAIA
jgi:signal transduction histidine kinase